MNPLLEAITALGNLQRDKHLKQAEIQKKKKQKNTGFSDVLKAEQERGKNK